MSSLRVKNGSTVAESFDVVLNTADLTYPTNISAKGLTAKSYVYITRTVVSVSQHYKNTKHVDLVQTRPHHHLIEN
jgi:hypothetical protein